MNILENSNINNENKLTATDRYETVENTIISNRYLGDITIAGALFSLSQFKDVTFKNCVFFGSRIENCTFSGCKFEDCTFQFSENVNCNFEETTFDNCHWYSSPINNCCFDDCYMDQKTAYFILKECKIAKSNIKRKLVA